MWEHFQEGLNEGRGCKFLRSPDTEILPVLLLSLLSPSLPSDPYFLALPTFPENQQLSIKLPNLQSKAGTVAVSRPVVLRLSSVQMATVGLPRPILQANLVSHFTIYIHHTHPAPLGDPD